MMEPKFSYYPTGKRLRPNVLTRVPLALVLLLLLVTFMSGSGYLPPPPKWLIEHWIFGLNIPRPVYLFMFVPIGLLPAISVYYRGKKLWKRALAEDLCWGCLYCLKGCQDEDSRCPECGLSCSGSRQRWALSHPNLMFVISGYEEQERVARKAEKKAKKLALKAERSHQ